MTHPKHKQDRGQDSSQTQAGSGSGLISNTSRIRTHPKHKQDQGQDSSQTQAGSGLSHKHKQDQVKHKQGHDSSKHK